MVRLPKESQPSRSSLRVATVRSLKDGAQSCDTSSTGKVKKPPRTGPAVSIASKQSAAPPPLVDPAIDVPKGQSLSNVPRLDRPWVIYDLSGKSFIVKPSRAGIGVFRNTVIASTCSWVPMVETSTVSDPVGNDRLLQSAGNEYAGGVSCLVRTLARLLYLD